MVAAEPGSPVRRNQRASARFLPHGTARKTLLVVVSLICVTLVGILETSQPGPAIAAGPTVMAGDAPARVVLPFTPNTTPSQR